MENYQMRRGCGRPYNTTCGMGNQRELPCARRTITGTPTASGKEMYTHVDHMEPAMAYVPCQNFAMTYDLSYALKVGTVYANHFAEREVNRNDVSKSVHTSRKPVEPD